MAVPGETKDYIGVDPVAWVDRLTLVCEASQFDAGQKKIIQHHLGAMQKALQTYAACGEPAP
jgi:hypothetical protein